MLRTSIAFSLLLCSVFSNPSISQTTFNSSFQPGASGEDSYVSSVNSGNNYGNAVHFQSTSQGQTITRSLIDFDISSLPNNITITDARLSLSRLAGSGPNNLTIQRITQSWQEGTVTWANQPSTDNAHQVNIPASTSPASYINIDVTDIISDRYRNPGLNFGMLIKMQIEQPNRTALFASSDHPDPLKRPKLVITYVKQQQKQPQNPYMALGKNQKYWDMTTHTLKHDISLNNGSDTPTHIIKDDCGNTKFSYHGSRIYDRYGNDVATLVGQYLLEVELTRIPGKPDEYYMIYYVADQGPINGLYYVTIDASGVTPIVSSPINIHGDNTGAIAVSRNSEGNERFLYTLTNNKVVRYLITSTGISGGTNVLSGIQDGQVLEMDLSHESDKLAWVYCDNAGTSYAYVVDLNPLTGTYINHIFQQLPGNGLRSGQGVEFDKTGNKLYMTIGNTSPDPNDGIYVLDLTTNTTSKIQGTTNYKITILEMGWDGNVYAVEHSSIAYPSNVGYIDESGNFHPAVFSANLPAGEIVVSLSPHQTLRVGCLPQQVDGEVYNQPINKPHASISLASSTYCDGEPILFDATGSMHGTSYEISVSIEPSNVIVWQKTFVAQPGVVDLAAGIQASPLYQCGANYNVSLEVSNACTSMITDLSFRVECNPQPIVSVNGCIVDPTTLTTFFGSLNSYQWYYAHLPIAGQTSSGHTAVNNGCYSVEVTDQYGCVGRSAQVGVGLTYPGAGPDATLCSGDPITLGDPNGYPCYSDFSYQWYQQLSNGSWTLLLGQTGSTATLYPTAPSNGVAGYVYRVDVTDNQTGCVQEDHVEVTVYGSNHVSCESSGESDFFDIDGDIELLPNPAIHSVKLNIPGEIDVPANIQIVDLLGRVKMEFETRNLSEIIDLSNMQNGSYFVAVIKDGITYSTLLQISDY